MSTRASIHFCDEEGHSAAIIYRHCDGYPDSEGGVLADMERFFAAVEEQTDDTRFGDPCYLAAKFVVWQAGEFKRRALLDFLSLGICLRDMGGIQYRYKVLCRIGVVPQPRPTVLCEEC